jgi:hypothetical protein
MVSGGEAVKALHKGDTNLMSGTGGTSLFDVPSRRKELGGHRG